MVREDRTRNLELPGSRYARPGMTSLLVFQPRPAIEPAEIAIPIFRRLRAHDGVADTRVLAIGVIDMLADRARQQREAAAALAKLDPAIPPDAPIKSLKVAQRQIVAICRGLAAHARVLFMDEPTASLTRREVELLLETVRRLR